MGGGEGEGLGENDRTVLIHVGTKYIISKNMYIYICRYK